MMEIGVEQLCENIYVMNEANKDSAVDAYLILGSERAALVDTLQDATGLYEKVREFTSLPLDVLITHGHGDHVGRSIMEFADAGCRIYMDLKDVAELQFFNPDVKVDSFIDLKEGMIFDLGGYKLETIYCGGHTLGSVVFLDRERQLLFSGDSIGSGNFWMQLPGSMVMTDFYKNLTCLQRKLEGMDKLVIHPGHRWQMPGQLTAEYIEDVAAIAEGIIDGKLVGTEEELHFGNIHMPYRIIEQGMVCSFCYDPNKIGSV